MMRNTTVLTAVTLVACGLHAALAPAARADEQAIRQNLDEYCAAFNRGDIDAVMSFWAENADYVDEQGETHRGKPAIGAVFKNSIDNLQGHQLDLEIEALKQVTPNVAVEDGVATLTAPDGTESSGDYTAVWVKSGERWLITSARELPRDAEAEAPRNADYLEPLEWIIGNWKSEDDGPAVNLQCRWGLDKNFILQEYSVAGGEGTNLEVSQWVGFDPVTGQVKSWTFDSLGGHGEAYWVREGNSWQAEATGVLPGGRIGTAVNTLRFIDDTHMEWTSTGRNVEGQPLPDAKVRFVRTSSAD